MKVTGSSGKYKNTSSEVVHENPWFKVKRDGIIKPNGQPGEYFVVQPSQNVTIAAVNDAQELCLIKLFRYPTQVTSIELPSGGTEGGDPLEAAKRELQEETGLLAKKWTEISRLQMANGLSDQWSHVFLAQGLSETDSHEQEEEGVEEVLMVPFPRVLEMIDQGKITDMITIAVVMLVAQRLKIRLQ